MFKSSRTYAGFEETWATVLDGWGKKMLAAVQTVAEMAALGFGLPSRTFTDRMQMGPHLLAPTGSPLPPPQVSNEKTFSFLLVLFPSRFGHQRVFCSQIAIAPFYHPKTKGHKSSIGISSC